MKDLFCSTCGYDADVRCPECGDNVCMDEEPLYEESNITIHLTPSDIEVISHLIHKEINETEIIVQKNYLKRLLKKLGVSFLQTEENEDENGIPF